MIATRRENPPQQAYTTLRDFYPIPQEIEAEVHAYRTFLESLEERRGHRDQAGNHVVPLSFDLEERHSAKTVATLFQMLVICGTLFLALGGGLILPMHVEVTFTLMAITTLYLGQLFLHALLTIRQLARPDEDERGSDSRVVRALWRAPWPDYTILCPLYQEAQVVPQFLEAISKIDYPHDRLQVLLLTEEDDLATRDAIRALSPLPAHIELLVVPQGMPRTKPRACNYGLSKATGRYVVVYDAEDVPEVDQLKKAVLAFAKAGPQTACVQARLAFYNTTQNILTRLFAIEYLAWFSLILPAFARAGFALPLGGTSNHFQAAVLRALGGWDAYNVTEDCDLGLRLSQYGFVTGMLDSTTHEEATSSLSNWIRQRSRWIKGFLQTYLVHTRHPLEAIRKGRTRTLLSMQALVGGSFVVFINPVMWGLLVVYILFRNQVEGTYHVLFPTPVLYGGALCLIFGNFLYVYLCMLICARREKYNLVPWCFLLLPYWGLMSLAATKALYQLITRPHYWEKTRHGFHLGRRGQESNLVGDVSGDSVAIEDKTTNLIPVVENGHNRSTATITMRMRAITTLPMAVAKIEKDTTRKKRDPWLWATFLVASSASSIATVFYYQAHEILLYGDAHSHMRIARSVFDSATPGLAQLGTVWLPLPHILMWPFIWNDFLWHSGLAGSFPSMGCFILSSVLLYLIIKRYTNSGSLSFAGTLLFVLNPNALYLQATPLSELTCIATFLATSYAFLRWVDEESTTKLAITAFLAFLCTLARYDGWATFVALAVLIIGVEVVRRRPWRRMIGHALIFVSLGGLGIILWFLWNALLFGNPLYFQKGPYSAQAQQEQSFFKVGTLYSYHNLWISIRDYVLTSVAVIGTLPLILATLALFLYLISSRRSILAWNIFFFLTPFAFYVISLYTGQGVIQLPALLPPGTSTALFNVRYGIQMLIPCTIFIAIGLSHLPLRRWFIGHTILIAIALFQVATITSGGVITVQEGIRNTCAENPQEQINFYLAEHYDQGYILEDAFTSSGFEASSADIDFHNVIYQGSGTLWTEALIHPAHIVEWVTFDPHESLDQVRKSPGVHSSLFLKDFTLVLKQPNGRLLYHRKGLPPLPNRALPADLAAPYQLCTGKHPWDR